VRIKRKRRPGAKSKTFILRETARENMKHPRFHLLFIKLQNDIYETSIVGPSLNKRSKKIL
jgi:hypothetical protein